MEECIFCKIASGQAPAIKRFEDDDVVAFDTIQPKAPVHILVIPKHHITSLAEASSLDQQLLGHMLVTVRNLAAELGMDGYKTQINTGRSGGQVVDHLHIHLVGADPKRQGVGFQGIAPEVEV